MLNIIKYLIRYFKLIIKYSMRRLAGRKFQGVASLVLTAPSFRHRAGLF
jgi:hypothetical protein